MSGTKIGGKNAAATNKKRYGSDYYARIGAKGGRNGKTGGFYANRELASAAGKKGGRLSRRGKDPIDELSRQRIEKAFELDIERAKLKKRQETKGASLAKNIKRYMRRKLDAVES